MRHHRHTKAKAAQKGRGVVEQVDDDPWKNYDPWEGIRGPRHEKARNILIGAALLFLLFVLLGFWRKFSIWREERFLDQQQKLRDQLDSQAGVRRTGPIALRLKRPAQEAVWEQYNPLDEEN